jgi:ubiquitin-protein ligase
MNKRLLHEINRLVKEQISKPNILDNDYIIDIDETDNHLIQAIIKAPKESVYKHTFIRLSLKIPDNYPHSPPEVTFVNHDSVRIHPNMYEDGKCCATILNTWPSDNEKWTSSMGIETILLAFMSFLDYNPYTHEPGGRDDPSYTIYVRYQSFKTCLIRYLQYETNEVFLNYMIKYLVTFKEEIMNDLRDLEWEVPFDFYYTSCFEIDRYYIDYSEIRRSLRVYMNFLEPDPEKLDSTPGNLPLDSDPSQHFLCEICFDTLETNEEHPGPLIQLECYHFFHEICLKAHIRENGEICPICRKSSTAWVINPCTKRRLKRDSRTYNKFFKR